MPSRTPRRLWLAVSIVALTLGAGFLAAACGGGGDGDSASRPTTGAGIYKAYCSTCHGVDGQGGVGAKLGGGAVVAKYPDIEAQIAVVTDGTGRMPAFRGTLSAAEIRKVVEYERSGALPG